MYDRRHVSVPFPGFYGSLTHIHTHLGPDALGMMVAAWDVSCIGEASGAEETVTMCWMGVAASVAAAALPLAGLEAVWIRGRPPEPLRIAGDLERSEVRMVSPPARDTHSYEFSRPAAAAAVSSPPPGSDWSSSMTTIFFGISLNW